MSKQNNHSVNIGLDVNPPKDSCTDKNCPFHGGLKVHGKTFVGTVYSSRPQKTAIVEWSRRVYMPKYERFGIKRTRIAVHNPSCIGAVEGDKVRIGETRPLSKTKNFVIIEKIGHVAHFQQEMEAREEAAVKKPKAAAPAEEDAAGAVEEDADEKPVPEDTSSEDEDSISEE